jgi:prepilin-type N-terminal cleavage/methylation domain-containing protein
MKIMKRALENQAGFTLVELMIALVVITLVIGGYVGANIAAQRNSEEMHERTIAIQDANRTIEQIRNVSRTGTFPSNVTTEFPPNGAVAGFANLTNEQVVVSYVNANGNPLLATVTVTWLSYPQRQNTERVQCYITQR